MGNLKGTFTFLDIKYAGESEGNLKGTFTFLDIKYAEWAILSSV